MIHLFVIALDSIRMRANLNPSLPFVLTFFFCCCFLHFFFIFYSFLPFFLHARIDFIPPYSTIIRSAMVVLILKCHHAWNKTDSIYTVFFKKRTPPTHTLCSRKRGSTPRPTNYTRAKKKKGKLFALEGLGVGHFLPDVIPFDLGVARDHFVLDRPLVGH